MSWKLKSESEAMFGGEIEVDESYFGGRRNGKRGRGAAGKIPAFGLSLPDSCLFANHEKVKRGGKVYTKIIPDAASATLIPIIKRKVVPASR
jgi:transposase